MWKNKTDSDKRQLVLTLREKRQQLRTDSKKRIAKTSKHKMPKIVFKSKELEDLFKSIPEDIKKRLF